MEELVGGARRARRLAYRITPSAMHPLRCRHRVRSGGTGQHHQGSPNSLASTPRGGANAAATSPSGGRRRKSLAPQLDYAPPILGPATMMMSGGGGSPHNSPDSLASSPRRRPLSPTQQYIYASVTTREKIVQVSTSGRHTSPLSFALSLSLSCFLPLTPSLPFPSHATGRPSRPRHSTVAPITPDHYATSAPSHLEDGGKAALDMGSKGMKGVVEEVSGGVDCIRSGGLCEREAAVYRGATTRSPPRLSKRNIFGGSPDTVRAGKAIRVLCTHCACASNLMRHRHYTAAAALARPRLFLALSHKRHSLFHRSPFSLCMNAPKKVFSYNRWRRRLA